MAARLEVRERRVKQTASAVQSTRQSQTRLDLMAGEGRKGHFVGTIGIADGGRAKNTQIRRSSSAANRRGVLNGT